MQTPHRDGSGPRNAIAWGAVFAWSYFLAFNLIVDFILNSPNVRRGRPAAPLKENLSPTNKVCDFSLELEIARDCSAWKSFSSVFL